MGGGFRADGIARGPSPPKKKPMNRFRIILIFIGICGLQLNLAFGTPARDKETEHPVRYNIITIITDDQGAWALGAYGNREIVTPNIDRLAREGAMFTNAFACSGVCAPSRAGLLTGCYPIQLGFSDAPYLRNPNEGLPTGAPSWPRVLWQNGYRTALIGKWHLGGNLNYHPSLFGIDHFFGFLGGGNRPMDPVLMRDRTISEYNGSLPDILVDETISFLGKNRKNPFALMLHFRAPHAPHIPVPVEDMLPFKGLDPSVPMVNPELAGLDDDQEPASPEANALHTKLLKAKMLTYYASIHSIDRNIGRLLGKLQELGLAENTIIFFSSDQGYLFGHRGLKGKGAAQPIRNHTLADNIFYINCFDPALKIPLIVRWPGVVTPGTVLDDMVSNIDTYATVLGMLSIPKQADIPATSRDFSPLLRGESVDWRQEVFAEYTPDQIGSMEFIRMVRTKRWKLVRRYLNPGGNQLYDLETDPDEMINLYYKNLTRLPPDREGPAPQKEHPYKDILEDLQGRMTRWQESINDPVIRMERIYNEAKEAFRARWRDNN